MNKITILVNGKQVNEIELNKLDTEGFIEYTKNPRFNPNRQIAFIWSIDDVRCKDEAKNLTDDQCIEILRRFEHHHEGSMDAMWWDLEYHTNEFIEELGGTNA